MKLVRAASVSSPEQTSESQFQKKKKWEWEKESSPSIFPYYSLLERAEKYKWNVYTSVQKDGLNINVEFSV